MCERPSPQCSVSLVPVGEHPSWPSGQSSVGPEGEDPSPTQLRHPWVLRVSTSPPFFTLSSPVVVIEGTSDSSLSPVCLPWFLRVITLLLPVISLLWVLGVSAPHPAVLRILKVPGVHAPLTILGFSQGPVPEGIPGPLLFLLYWGPWVSAPHPAVPPVLKVLWEHWLPTRVQSPLGTVGERPLPTRAQCRQLLWVSTHGLILISVPWDLQVSAPHLRSPGT